MFMFRLGMLFSSALEAGFTANSIFEKENECLFSFQ